MKYSNMQETKTSTSTEYHTPMTREVKSIRELQEMIALGQPLVNLAFQNMDLTSLTDTLINSGIRESLFLGCLLENRAACRLQRENYIFPIMDLPYPIYPTDFIRRKIYMKIMCGQIRIVFMTPRIKRSTVTSSTRENIQLISKNRSHAVFTISRSPVL